MQLIKILGLAILTIAVVATVAYAASAKQTVVFKVLDGSTYQSVPHASIKITDYKGNTYSFITDENGEYSMSNLPQSKYYTDATTLGYGHSEGIFNYPSDGNLLTFLIGKTK